MSMEPIKLYVGEQYREPKLSTHVDLLFPFWGVAIKESMPYVRRAAEQYQYSKEDFILVEHIQDADFVLVPYNYERLKNTNPRRLDHIVRDAQQAGKPLLIDGAGDREWPITLPHSVILRVSQYTYAVQSNEVPIPYGTEDLLEVYGGGVVSLRKKQDIPSVGFVGWSDPGLRTLARAYLRDLSTRISAVLQPKRGAERKGLFFRSEAIHALRANKAIDTQFVTRRSYSGHVETLEGNVEENRRRFVDNLLSTDYALCVRGDANASVRFYEALSLGRIPLFVDTACVLPLQDKINYREFCVFVDWQDVKNIDKILLNFHAKVSPDQFTQMQQKAREAYVNYLRRDAFSKELARLLRERLSHA
jgi:Exostosin family